MSMPIITVAGRLGVADQGGKGRSVEGGVHKNWLSRPLGSFNLLDSSK